MVRCLPPARFQSAAAPANESAHRCGSKYPNPRTMRRDSCRATVASLMTTTRQQTWSSPAVKRRPLEIGIPISRKFRRHVVVRCLRCRAFRCAWRWKRQVRSLMQWYRSRRAAIPWISRLRRYCRNGHGAKSLRDCEGYHVLCSESDVEVLHRIASPEENTRADEEEDTDAVTCTTTEIALLNRARRTSLVDFS